MERYAGSFLEEVRARTLLSALIGQHVPLARAGRGEWLGLCPFHSEKTPSFTVQDQKGFWHRFGCGANGDAFAWMQAFHSLSFTDAVEELAVAAGLAPDREGRVRPEAVPVTAKAPADDHGERERRKGWELWRQRRPIAGTAADT